MKTKLSITVTFAFCMSCIFAQSSRDTTVLREGNLTYIIRKDDTFITIESVETAKEDKTKGQSYIEAIVDYPTDMVIRHKFRSIFSEQRATELENLRLQCIVGINSVEKRTLYVYFRMRNDREFKITLEELNQIENILKSIQWNFRIYNYKTLAHPMKYSIPIVFNKLYDNCE